MKGVKEELLKVAKPILFNTEMVRAMLEDRKTATRRIVKPQLSEECPSCKHVHNEYIYDVTARNIYCARCGEPLKPEKRAPYHPGDILYVRETWTLEEFYDDEALVHFKAGGNIGIDYECEGDTYRKLLKYADKKWIPSLFMPKEAARIFLRVKDVRVERLQDITEEQALKEGIHYDECPAGYTWKKRTSMVDCYTSAVGAFGHLWNTTIKSEDRERYSWESSPWVWVIEFERIEPDAEV